MLETLTLTPVPPKQDCLAGPWKAVVLNPLNSQLNVVIHSFDQLPLEEGRTRTGMHVWHGRGAGLTSMAWEHESLTPEYMFPGGAWPSA